MLKIEEALILCIVAVLAKTCLVKFTPTVRRTSYNFTSGENSRSSYLATIKRIEKQFLLLKVHLMYINILQKSHFRYFDPFQHER